MATVDRTIPERMQGVTCVAPRDYRMEEKPVPTVGPDDILVKVGACGICAGDAKCYAGVPMFWGDDKRKAYVEAPVTPGHEFVGEVVAMGEAAARREAAKETGGITVGSAVVSEQIVPCWECRYCKTGLRWLCRPHDIYGFHQRTHGGMAEYMLFPQGSCNYLLPKGLAWHELAFCEPLSCAVHGVERGNIQFGDVVVVSGCGPIGLGMIAAAKKKSPGRLVALDLSPKRLEIARKCGADIVLNPREDDVAARIRELTDGYGCDVYMEATGHPSSVEQGLMLTRKMGNFVEFSVFADKTAVDWTIIGDTKELNILGGHLSGDRGYVQAIEMLRSGAVPTEDIVTHKLPLAEFEAGIGLVSKGTESIKVVLTP